MFKAIRDYFQRRRVKAMFGDYISPAAVERLIQSGSAPLPAATEQELTPFFASLHAYVSLAEQLPLPQLGELLEAHFEICSDEITVGDGTLDNFVGDAVVAMFGTPRVVPDHALRACVAALRCHARLGEVRARIRREGDRWPPRAREVRLRIGLHTGSALVGIIGARSRFMFAMMGDTVNLAARLEGAAKHYGAWTLCTGATQAACDRADPGRIVFRPLGPVVIQGRTAPLELFEPVAFRANAPDQLLECLGEFAAGLAHHRAGDSAVALRHFERSAALETDQPGTSPEIVTNPSLHYLHLLRTAENPPTRES